MQFRIFKKENIIQGISDVSFGSMAGKKGDERAMKFLKSLGHKNDIKNLIWAEQVFGAKVHICKADDSGKTIKGADGLISNIKNQVLAIVSADCLPILLFDPKREIAAALHGSRKSLIKGIIKKAIVKMVLNLNSNPSDILVGIGPHIRKCHYFIDLTKIAINDLLKAGIKRKNIEDCKICTFCSAKKYFSHRKKEKFPNFYKEKRPRFASFIGLKEKKILKVTPKNFQKTIKTAIKFIKEGKVLVCPTDTVYGLICDATNKKAVEKVFKIKKRPKNKALPIFVKDIKMAKKLAKIDKKQEAFLKKVWFSRPNFQKDFPKKLVKIAPKFWPDKGKVTAILKVKIISQKLKVYGLERKTIALRIPKHKLVLDLLKKTNKPLIGTSANISGKPASTKIKEVLKQLENQKYQPDLVLDAGNLPKSKPSKVIDLTTSPPKILRY